jgi:hypothetical protein
MIRKVLGKRPLERLSWNDNIKMDLNEIGFSKVDCIKIAQDWVYR